jgi:chemotaxis protein CheZ
MLADPFNGADPFAVESAEGDGGKLGVGLTTIRQTEIPRAIEQLDDIVQGTENAAHQILDACAGLDALAAELGGSVAEQIGRATTIIYEACVFQDLAGQRITNVTKTLGLIEGKLSELASQFGLLAEDYSSEPGPEDFTAGGSLDDVRLSGPQHPADAADQASIDRLFEQAQ